MRSVDSVIAETATEARDATMESRGSETRGSEPPLVLVECRALDTLRKRASVNWKPIETAPADGSFLVWLEEPFLGCHVQVACWRKNIKIIGGVFAFDAPKPTHWMPLPPGPRP